LFSYSILGALSRRRLARKEQVLIRLAAKALEEQLGEHARELACAALLLTSASCVPAGAAHLQTAAATPVTQALPPEPEPMVLRDVAPTEAAAINATIPLAGGPNLEAPSTIFAAATGLDAARSLNCLAEAVYYEARSESEDGQRAVAQVVLNRVRHPAYPASVCGVVYQGPLRAGGGCQFTFTCDGSLASPPGGDAWLRARRIAAEALAGSVYAPVGLATHYHTQQVLPVWAFKLAKAEVIGNHIFYRMPGTWGEPGAFTRRYAGREPSPATIVATRLPVYIPRAAPTLPMLAAWTPTTRTQRAEPTPPPVDDRLPQSGVKAEYATSGRWLSDAMPPSPRGSDGIPTPASTPASAN
jgi:spore germination cell wall hydrolase CwlJ-like protein